MKPKPFSHSFGESNFHLVFKVKYSHEILKDRIAYVCEKEFESIAEAWGMHIVTKKLVLNHVHMFASLRPDQSPSFAMHKFKGISANKLFKTFPWLRQWDPKDRKRFWGGQFWSDGYFFRSIGSTTDNAVKFYIEVANDPILRKKYYTFSGKRKKQMPKRKDDPYVSYIKGELRMPPKDQKKLTRFLGEN